MKIVETPSDFPGSRQYWAGSARELLVMSTKNPEDDLKLRISVSHQERYPTWDELVAIKKELAPDLFMVQVITPEEHHYSLHPYCFHLWEVQPDKRWLRGMV